ncbi:MAG: sensor domain-containing diguanylate cyclase [Acidimicrobiia bacterium]
MITRDAISATENEWSEAHKQSRRRAFVLSVVALVLVPALSVLVSVLAEAVVSGDARYLVAGLILGAIFVPIVTVMYRSSVAGEEHAHELGKILEGQLSEAIGQAEREAAQRERQVRHQEFSTRLANALEMAEGETEVLAIAERALALTLPDAPVEMLLADNSHAHLSRMALASPTGEPPGCGVDSPHHCPAARRAQVQRFDDSEDLDACPKLRGRPSGPCSAICMPVSIMGRTVGVIHAAGEPHRLTSDDTIQDLATLANLAGARIGLLRVMSESQLQAATDSLTGLRNRRSLENAVRALHGGSSSYSVVMADLDHFKELNDTYGHQTGDRALRLFAHTLRGALRDEDLVSRHGGEEFVVVLPGCSVHDTRTALEKVRTKLEQSIQQAGLPHFTASFGAIGGERDDDLSELINRADAALFDAKRAGRDRIVVHDLDGGLLAPDTNDATHVDWSQRSPSRIVGSADEREPEAVGADRG